LQEKRINKTARIHFKAIIHIFASKQILSASKENNFERWVAGIENAQFLFGVHKSDFLCSVQQIYCVWLNKNSSPNTLNEIRHLRRMRKMKLIALGEVPNENTRIRRIR